MSHVWQPPNGLELSCGVTCPTAALWQAGHFPHHIPNYGLVLAARKLILANFLAGSEFALARHVRILNPAYSGGTPPFGGPPL